MRRSLAAYLEKTDDALGDPRYLTDLQGHDLASGTDRSDLLKVVQSEWAAPVPKDGHIIRARVRGQSLPAYHGTEPAVRAVDPAAILRPV